MVDLSRRRFLGMTSLAGTSFLSPASPALGAGAARKMKMSLVCGTIGVKATQLEAIELASRYGFEAVEPQPDYLESLSDAELRTLLDGLKSKRLEFGAASVRVDFRAEDQPFQAAIKRLPSFAKTLQRAGVTRATRFITPCHPTLAYAENFKRHALRLREVATVLGDHGVRIGLEYVSTKDSRARDPHPFVYNMKGMRELIAEAGKPNVGLLLDSYFWYTARETADDVLALTNKDVVSVDLDDAPAGIPIEQQQDQRRELPAATGVIDLATFLNCLNKIGFDGPVRAEPFNEALRKLPREEAVAATSHAMKKAFALIR
jgi:sugar phosphate isomerase/epimerase